MKQYIILSVVCLLAITTVVQAADERSAFRGTTSLSTKSIVVPTVVEVPVNVLIERKEFAVYERETDSYLPYYYNEQYVQQPVQLKASVNTVGSAAPLLDDEYKTSIDFSLPDSGLGVAEVMLQSKEFVSSSAIVLALAPNVARPLYVSLHALTQKGIEETIVAEKRLTGNRILFPKTTATQWRLELIYAQPLRLAEVTLLQDDVEKSVTRSLRFLAQPQYTYDIYLNPDRAVSIPTSESGNLHTDKGVVKITSPVQIITNPLYLQADVDLDGIPDVMDNCVSIANEDQIDEDYNDRGDACDDFDRDGRINSVDNCPNDPNRNQRDEDGDGVGDVCDDEDSRITEKYSWIPWVGLGFAILVLVGMFVIVLRRKPGMVEVDEIAEG